MTTTTITPYLFFAGRCEEALEFYRKAVGATIEFTLRTKDAPEQPPAGTLPAGSGEKLTHAAFKIGETRGELGFGLGDLPSEGWNYADSVPLLGSTQPCGLDRLIVREFGLQQGFPPDVQGSVLPPFGLCQPPVSRPRFGHHAVPRRLWYRWCRPGRRTNKAS